MSVVVVGANHKSMPLDTLGRLSMSEADRVKFAFGLTEAHNLSEVVVLSTCNRTEIYGLAERFHGAYADIRTALAQYAGLAIDEIGDQIYVRWGEEAVQHLFSVAAGLDSAVIGETEIVGQLRHAWDGGRKDGQCGPALNLLFRQALEVAKRARTETTISAHTTSVAGAAVQLASAGDRPLSDLSVVLIGSGQMGRTLGRLLAGNTNSLHVVNRTPSAASALAAEIGASSSGFFDLDSALETADLVISATGAPGAVLSASDVARIMERRGDASLRLVDIAMPRDIDPLVRELSGVELFDMVSVRELIETGLERRRDEIESVEIIVQEEVARYNVATTARSAGPVVRALREQVEDVRRNELDRYSGQMARLGEEERALIDSITRSVLAKVVHSPTVRLKDTAGTLRGDRLADAIRDLFDLG